jgi:hypothetical protein
MFAYRDFVPMPVDYEGPAKGILGQTKVPEFETFDAAVVAATEWARREAVRVINVETVVLPHANVKDARAVEETRGAVVPGHKVAFWEQFLRVWYEVV